MNKIMLMGRLTKDPEIRYANKADGTQTAIGRFSVAVDRKIKKKDGTETDFFNCVAFGKLGEFAEKYLKKGTKIVLSGRMENDSYTNRDGVKVSAWQVNVEEVEFAESKKAQEQPEEKKPEWVPTDDLDDELPFKF